MEKRVSQSVVNRLPRYYRYLTELESSRIERISSKDLSRKMNVTASQIRQDLNCFGGFGQQGYGYNVKFLKDSIGKILGLEKGHTAILVGAGNMGRAFAMNTNFESRGFKLIGVFDSDPQKYGVKIGANTIMPYSQIKEFIKENDPQMAILAVPKGVVNTVAEELMSCGIKVFMNFSHAELSAEWDIEVENVHLGDSLMRLSYKINEREMMAEDENAVG